MADQYALLIGEVLVDLIEDLDADGSPIYRPRYGGSPLNVAVGLRRLGTPTVLAAAFGSDVFGRRLRAYLMGQGIRLVGPPDSGMGTVLAVAMAEKGHVRYEFFGDFGSLTAIPQIDAAHVASAAVVHAGSTALNVDPAYATAVSAYRAASGFRTMDPNPRPFLIDNLPRYRTSLEAAAGLVELVKLSADDMAYLYPSVSLRDGAARIRAGGAATVIVTRADEDTLVFFEDELRSIPVPVIEPVDCTGAGDSFMASAISRIVRDGRPRTADDWADLARAGNAAAAITCMAVGGAAAMPTNEQVQTRLLSLARPEQEDLR